MKRWMGAVAATGALAALGAGAVGAASAQDRGPFAPGGDGPRGPRSEMSQADRDAFSDARIAALHAGLKLTPDQEKLWPPVEGAIRGLVAERQAARQARRERFASLREAGPHSGQPVDIPAQLRFMADRQAASADAIRKLADASGPLYGALDDGQKRRIAVLGRGLLGGPAVHRHGFGGRGGPGEGRGWR